MPSELDLVQSASTDTVEAENNSQRLTDSWAAKIVPVVQPGTYYFRGSPSKTPVTVGCKLWQSEGGRAIPLGGHPTLTGSLVRFVKLDDNSFLNCRGTGAWTQGPVEITNFPGSFKPAIIVEGRGNAGIPTGRHTFSNICFSAWTSAFDALAGYYDDDGEFVDEEQHADNCEVNRCETFDCPFLFRSYNQQADGWEFNSCMMNDLAHTYDTTGAALYRGGSITFKNLKIECKKFVHFEVRDFSPNNCQLTSHDLWRDRMPDNDSYFRLLKFSGSFLGKWALNVDGFLATYQTNFDKTKLFDVPSKLPRTDFVYSFRGLPAF